MRKTDNIKMDIYHHLPIFAQNIACCAEGMRIKHKRYGKYFAERLAEYESHNAWTYEQLCEYRDRRLQKMIMHCYKTVPYYRKSFDEMGINPTRIKRLDDLKELPILNKQIINKQPEMFLSSALPKKRMVAQHTSGTTGAGFVFYSTQEAICEQWAVWWRYRRNLGIQLDTWCAIFGGRSVVPVTQSNSPFYRMNYPGRQIYFSAYHMSRSNMIHYVNVLEKYKPVWLHGYPSSIALLAQYMYENDIQLSYRIKWITTGAETLLQQQKNIIRKVFGIVPFQHYGMSEGVANISENISHQFIIDEDYASIEFLKNESLNSYRIIGTNLTNYVMPLIRYDVGDNAILEGTRLVTDIDGRKEDYLVLGNGIHIGRLDHIFKDLINVREAQIYQNQDGKIVFYIVKSEKFGQADEKLLKREIEERIGKESYQIQYVRQIERTKSGKIRFVVSERKV